MYILHIRDRRQSPTPLSFCGERSIHDASVCHSSVPLFLNVTFACAFNTRHCEGRGRHDNPSAKHQQCRCTYASPNNRHPMFSPFSFDFSLKLSCVLQRIFRPFRTQVEHSAEVYLANLSFLDVMPLAPGIDRVAFLTVSELSLACPRLSTARAPMCHTFCKRCRCRTTFCSSTGIVKVLVRLLYHESGVCFA